MGIKIDKERIEPQILARFNEELNKLDLSNKEITQATGTDTRSIYYYKVGTVAPKLPFLLLLKNSYPDFDVSYIITGVKPDKSKINLYKKSVADIKKITDKIETKNA